MAMSDNSAMNLVEAPELRSSLIQKDLRRRLISNLYADYFDELKAYIVKKFGTGPPEPEEAAQATFVRMAALEEPEKIDNPRGYLFATAKNIIADHHRRTGRRDAYRAEMEARAADGEMSVISPERVLIGKERFEVFKSAVASMPLQRRRIFLLCRVEGRSCEEVAQRFGMSVGAVHKHISRAVKDCAVAFERHELGE